MLISVTSSPSPKKQLLLLLKERFPKLQWQDWRPAHRSYTYHHDLLGSVLPAKPPSECSHTSADVGLEE